MEKKKQKFLMFSGILALVLIAILFIFSGSGLFGFLTAEEEKQSFDEGDYLKNIREKYGELPEDFYEIRNLIYIEQYDLATVEEEYYKYPQFMNAFENQYWEKVWLPRIENPPVGRFAPFGIVSVPSQGVVVIDRKNIKEDTATLTKHFFLGSGVLVEKYQGFTFNVNYPASSQIEKLSFPDGKTVVEQNVNKAKSYFTTRIAPQLSVLGPSFPVFNEEWIQKITLEVDIPKDIEPGDYIIGISLTAPPKSCIDDEWAQKITSDECNIKDDDGDVIVDESVEQELVRFYKTAYTPGGSYSPGRNVYELFIRIQ